MNQKYLTVLRVCQRQGWSSEDIELFIETNEITLHAKSVRIKPTEWTEERGFRLERVATFGNWLVLECSTETSTSTYRVSQQSSRKEQAEAVNRLVKYGFSKAPPDGFEQAKTLWLENEKLARTARRKTEGFVFPGGSEAATREEHQGGFSDEVFHQERLQSYLKTRTSKGVVHAAGFIGSSSRRPNLDERLEHHLRLTLAWSPEEIAEWLTSSEGRHFASDYSEQTNLHQVGFTNYFRLAAPPIVAALDNEIHGK